MSPGFPSRLSLARLLLGCFVLVTPPWVSSRSAQQPNPPSPPPLVISTPQSNAQLFSPVPVGISCSCHLVGPLSLSVDGVADTTDQLLIANDTGFVASGKVNIPQAGPHTLTAVANVGCPNPLNPGNPSKFLISASVTFTVLVHTYAFSYDQMGNLTGVSEITPPHPNPPPPGNVSSPGNVTATVEGGGSSAAPRPPRPRGGGSIALITFTILLAVWSLERVRRGRRARSLRVN